MKPKKKLKVSSRIPLRKFRVSQNKMVKLVLLVLCTLACTSQVFGESLESILARMDQSAPRFQGATAKLVLVNYTAILGDTTTERGTLQMQRQKSSDVRAIIDFSALPENARVVSFQGKSLKIYYPNTKEVQEYAVGKNADVLNQFLLLGFGSSGKDLQANYVISEKGTEAIGGRSTTKLQLIPKDAELKSKLSEVELWIPTDATYPLQQKFSESKASGNYRQVTYTDVQINPAEMKKPLEFKIPANTSKKKGD
jgi:outer membrane lipoprotein-sorting protein